MIAAVYCLWEIDEKFLKRGKDDLYEPTFGKLWKLAEVYAVDGDGCPITEAVYGDYVRGGFSYEGWIRKKIWYDEKKKKFVEEKPDTDKYIEPSSRRIPGRVVTVWTPSGGVNLAAFNPPCETRWLNLEHITKVGNWVNLIEDGTELYMKTSYEALRLFTKHIRESIEK